MAVPPDMSDLRSIEKELVAEQPGLPVGLAGIILVIFMGLALRAALGSERIFHLISAAAEKMDPHLTTRIGSAQISLADGIWPELAVVIRDSSIESSEYCWMMPALDVDELKLPVDIWHLLRGEIYVHEAIANEVSLSLRSDLSQCPRSKKSAEIAPTLEASRFPSQAQPQSDNAGAWDQWAKSNNTIDSVHVNRLRVHYLPSLFTSFEIRGLDVSVKAQAPREVEASGILSLAGETLSGDYSSTASLKVGFKEQPEPQWSMSVDGNWREGHYELHSEFVPHDQDLQLTFDLSQIPLNQLLPLMRKYHVVNADFNGKQTWLTARGRYSGQLNSVSPVPLQLDVLRLEGLMGEIEVQRLKITHMNPLQFDPFDMEIKSLQLDGLMAFLGEKQAPPILGKLGVFHGQMRVQDLQNLRLRGEHSGLEVVFSSRGLRQTQIISLIDGEATYQKGQWQMRIDHLRPAEGLFLGDFRLDSDADFSKVNVHGRVDELTLSPAVQKLITNGGGIGSIAGDVAAHLDHSRLADLHGHLSVTDLQVENLSVKKGRASFSTKENQIILELHAQGLLAQEGGEPYRYLALVMEPPKPGLFEFQSAGGSVKTHELRDLSWEDFHLQGVHASVHAKGGWNENGELRGEILTSGVQRQKFILSGVRDKPMITRQSSKE